LYGPPGTGKTTLAMLVSSAIGRRFVALSALSAGVKEVRGVIEEARRRLTHSGESTVLFIDEVHRFSRTQQDALLGAVEDRIVLLTMPPASATRTCPQSRVVLTRSPWLRVGDVPAHPSSTPDYVRSPNMCFSSPELCCAAS
jgi:replication-associated recombination protein RarA